VENIKSMKTKQYIFYLTLLGLLLFFVLSIGCTQPFGNKLFFDAPVKGNPQPVQTMSDPTIVRSRNVIVNQDILHTDDIIQLNLFGDVSFNLKKHRIEKRGQDRFTWFGSVEGQKNSQVILTVENGGMAGNIMVEGQTYQIRDLGRGIHTIREIDQSRFPEGLPPTPVDEKLHEAE